jgi:predicted anti-sigma-YlaC factor YlaD
MLCTEFTDVIDELLESDPAGWDPELLGHLHDCPPCLVYLQQMQDLRRMLDELARDCLPADDRRIAELLARLR